MTDQGLIARLREADDLGDSGLAMVLCAHAADRIEELVKELQDTEDRANAFATKEYYTEMRAEAAEAKLAKAVEALRETGQAIMVNTKETSWRLWGEGAVIKIRNVLAELEGGE